MKLKVKFLHPSVFFAAALLLFSCAGKKNESSAVKNYAQFNSQIPQRIVSLSPASTEILCATGNFEKLVARTDFCDYPSEVSKIPSAGGFSGKALSLETILSFKPDMVYLTSGMHDHFIPQLTELKINHYVSNSSSLREIIQEISDIGLITDHKKLADEVIEQINSGFNKISEKTSSITEKPGVYWEVWNQPYITAGKYSFITELIEICGGINIFGGIDQSYPVVSEELILVKNPDVIIVPETYSESIEDIKKRSGWEKTSAYENNRIFALNTDLISRPCPRIKDAALLIARTLYPEVDF